ncbi:TetR/AcrR family transcriptional regulator [uncultured Tateyamaria sp.]|uniref:TetR/AcrR family transcriptional regulator n=1 Tax=uncultured Tateyamaria sp. TaxID=455651 RepID=UPI0026094019|nr:TetR/AcrR family transcriptional regulator [uncultured Tateyamaria sp.]
MTTSQKRTRGRPRKFDIESGVRQAQLLFASRGYDVVGVSEICDTLGITPTSLYSAFGNKLGLYERAVEAYASSTGRFVGEALEQAQTEREVWDKVLRAAADAYTSGEIKGCLVLDGTLTSQDPEANALVAAQAQGTQLVIAERLQELGAEEAESSASTILILMRGLSASARNLATKEDLEAVVDLVLIAKD